MGCSACSKCEWVRNSAFCGKKRLTEKQLYNKNGFCSKFEPLQKDKPKKPEIEKAMYDFGSFWFICPVCYSILNIGENCQTCKQVIDWSEQI